jgi:hypothetical protein
MPSIIKVLAHAMAVWPSGRVKSEREMRKIIVALTAVGLIAGSAPSLAAPCRDAKGKFIKCPAKAPVKTTRCRDANGKFAKCGTPVAKPA